MGTRPPDGEAGLTFFRRDTPIEICFEPAPMPRPLLDNAPLAEVAAEIRFHGELDLYRHWGAIQSELRAEYPQLLVPPSTPRAVTGRAQCGTSRGTAAVH